MLVAGFWVLPTLAGGAIAQTVPGDSSARRTAGSEAIPAESPESLGGEPAGEPVLQEVLAVEPARSERRIPDRADYQIEARLDGETKRLKGSLELRWTNNSGESVEDLWFHLYMNAFSNNRSTFMRESKGDVRKNEDEDGWGWSQVTDIRVEQYEGDADLMHTFQYRRPDDGNPDDRTVFSVDLPRPLPSGETIKVVLDWEVQLPRVRVRTGYKDDFLMVAQWFPKLGVYEPERGWNAHQFHRNTEWYADFGNYDVTLNLPIEYRGKVFGSGIGEGERTEGGRLEVRFAAPSSRDQSSTDAFGKKPLVHDFAWTADPRFVVKQFIFKFDEWAEDYPEEIERAREAFGDDEDLVLRPVDVTVLVHPEREDQVERHFRATSAALFFYGLWFGEYPYQHVTVVDPPWGGDAAGGMEYPTIFTCGTRMLSTEDMHRPEGVTIHECGHQFWYGLVGNNEFEAAWIDEGLNSFTDSEVLWRVYGPRRSTTKYAGLPVDGVRVASLAGSHGSDDLGGYALADALALRDVRIPLPYFYDPRWKPIRASGFLDWWRDQPSFTFVREFTDPRWADRSGYLSDPSSDPIDTNGWEYVDRMSYRTNSYRRPAVALRSLSAVIGDAPFMRGMRHFSREWRYDHPYPQDFYSSFQAGAEVEIDWYFEELFRSRGTVDWSVSVDQRERPDAEGFFQSEGGAFLERPTSETNDNGHERTIWLTEITFRNEGELCLPVPIRLTFQAPPSGDAEEGAEPEKIVEELIWTREEQQRERWMKLEFKRREKLISVEIDPERGYYIDEDMSNNSWFDEADTVAPWRWGERVLSQYQRYFHWVGGIGG
ncbi:MAG: hypothetical protein CMJ89_08545 [Planctomycetes bacterium]|nr:hypothetical protein [Planctomycetota bacterium]